MQRKISFLIAIFVISIAFILQFSLNSFAGTGPVQSGLKYRSVFDNYGCSGCHMYMHKNSTSGPAVAFIAALAQSHKKQWVINWIVDPAKYYKEPSVKALIHQFNEYMPNNGVTKKDAEKLYKYLMAVANENK